MQSNEVDGDRAELGRQVLGLVREIADRGAASRDPAVVGYAIQELTQVLYERTGNEKRMFEPVPSNQIPGLNSLAEELNFVNGCLKAMCGRGV